MMHDSSLHAHDHEYIFCCTMQLSVIRPVLMERVLPRITAAAQWATRALNVTYPF